MNYNKLTIDAFKGYLKKQSYMGKYHPKMFTLCPLKEFFFFGGGFAQGLFTTWKIKKSCFWSCSFNASMRNQHPFIWDGSLRLMDSKVSSSDYLKGEAAAVLHNLVIDKSQFICLYINKWLYKLTSIVVFSYTFLFILTLVSACFSVPFLSMLTTILIIKNNNSRLNRGGERDFFFFFSKFSLRVMQAHPVYKLGTAI